jgi:peptide/nickel transport system substrate-binding protein
MARAAVSSAETRSDAGDDDAGGGDAGGGVDAAADVDGVSGRTSEATRTTASAHAARMPQKAHRIRTPASSALCAPLERARAWAFALAIMPLASGACTRRGKDADDARPLEVIVANDPETLDPRYATDAVGLRATRLVHAGLVRLDPDTLAPRPYLAAAWRFDDPLTLVVELRDDVRFHSGAPLRAADVVATLRAFASPKVASRHARVVEAIAEVRADGDHRVVVHLARPHATLLTDLELPILRADQADSRPAPDGSLDGLGPYRVVRVERGDVLLEPAEGGPLPRPARAVVLRTVHDENARALRLEAGRADVALNLVSPMLLPALAGDSSLGISARPGANLTYVVVQHERAPLGDARVRRAISAAIDRGLITRTLFDGRARPAGGLLSPTHWAHADVPLLPFDAAVARQLLAQAGAGGSRLTLLTSTDRLRGDIARFVAQELEDVGLLVTVVPLELGTMIARLNAGDFDIAMLTIPEVTEPNVLRHFLHGAFVPPAGANRGRVRDAELDALLDAGDEEPDPDARRGIYARVEALDRERMHLVPLWYEDQVAVTSVRARSFVPSAEWRWLSLAQVP